jgi:hypothetical protein
MNERTPSRRSASLFPDLTPSPAEHFRICFFGSVLKLMGGVTASFGSLEKAIEQFPFLVGYHNELAGRIQGLSSTEAEQRWCESLNDWERGASCHLPLRALREAVGLSHSTLMWSLICGLAEEDARFGLLFETLQGTPNQRRPTFGFLRLCLASSSHDDCAMSSLARLTQPGALTVSNPEAPRQEWIFKFPALVWDALRAGQLHVDADWLHYHPPTELLRTEELTLPPATLKQVEIIPRLLEAGEADTIIVRGPRHNGRRTLLGAVARSLGRGVLEVKNVEAAPPANWNEAGALALLLNAIPITEAAPGPGEVARLPDLFPPSLPLGVTAGLAGGFSGIRATHAVILHLDLPGPVQRRQLWQRQHLASEAEGLKAIAEHFRLASGNIGRAAQLARAQAALANRTNIGIKDVLEATRLLDRPGLDTLARRLPAVGELHRLVVNERTSQELEHLACRCRHRETLPGALEGASAGRLNCGVRALFSGSIPGTGKTLAARLLAGTLQKDIYRLDLSSVVNKFIGETEKNLNRIFDCAEELDVILLLDEGDALMTRRTDVHSSNDRYANLETNFLLQRMESFQGILIVTTNARERIDPAFERRMDVIVEFGAPTAEERWQLWQSHLPATNAVDPQRLAEVASECEFTGGQIQNAVLHATLLALDNGGVVTSEYVEAAVRREYRKRGSVCPLRP